MGGINLKAKEGFKIVVQGTDFKLCSVNIRTRFVRSLCGKQLEVQANVYADESKFKQNEKSVLSVEVIRDIDNNVTHIPPVGNYGIVNIPENHDNNDLALSHDLVVNKLAEILELWHEQDKK